MPEVDPFFPTDPAQEHLPALALRREIHQAGGHVPDDDAPVQDLFHAIFDLPGQKFRACR